MDIEAKLALLIQPGIIEALKFSNFSELSVMHLIFLCVGM